LKALVTFAVLATGAALAASPLPASAEGVLTAEGVASAPQPGTVSGSISLGGLTPGGTFEVVNAYQVTPEESNCAAGACAERFLPGTYQATYSNCRGGSISGETETIGGGGTLTAGAPPANSGSFTLALDRDSSSASCDYSVSLTRGSFSAALAAVRAVRLDVWILSAGRVLGRFSSPTVHADWHADPAVIPEPPFAALTPVSALLVMGGAFLLPALRRRRPEVRG
jgi:hypothetical protein